LINLLQNNLCMFDILNLMNFILFHNQILLWNLWYIYSISSISSILSIIFKIFIFLSSFRLHCWYFYFLSISFFLSFFDFQYLHINLKSWNIHMCFIFCFICCFILSNIWSISFIYSVSVSSSISISILISYFLSVYFFFLFFFLL
jgi:hypothetical protein